MRPSRLYVLIIILLLQCFYIDNLKPIWLDEISSVLNSNVDSILILLKNFYYGADTNPPLYFILLHLVIKLFGENLIILRLLSLLFVIVGIFALLNISFIKNHKISLAIIIISAPFILFYLISEIRPYSLQFCLASVLLNIYANKNISLTKKRIILSVLGTLTIFTHYYSILYILPLIVYETYNSIKSRSYFEILIVNVPLILFLFWLPAIYNQIKIFYGHFWQDYPSIKHILMLPKYFWGKLLIINIIISLFTLVRNYSSIKQFILSLDKSFIYILFFWLIVPALTIILQIPFVYRYFHLTFIPLSIFFLVIFINEHCSIVKIIFTFTIISIPIIESIVVLKNNREEFRKLNYHLSFLNNFDILCESPHIFYQLDYYSKKNYKHKPYYILDFSSSISEGNSKNAIFDYYGNKNLKRFFEIERVLDWSTFSASVSNFIVINEKDRRLFEQRILNNNHYKVIKLNQTIYHVMKVK